jgi:acetylornithine deacetylase/succinyl-diaminopimelate desuccinylase family protein
MGKPAPNESPYYEHRVTGYLESLLRDWGVAAERIEVHPGRDNLLAHLPATVSTPSPPILLLEVHQDTVPIEGMTIPPFGADVRAGRLYGRGACDVKGGMAAMLTAFARLIDQPLRRADIVIAFVINEEFGFTGATKLVETWSSGQSRLLPRAPDAIIVAEPTNLDVVVAHKGVIRWRTTAHGRAGHSSNPQRGANAIYAMARAIAALEEVADSLATTEPHSMLGRPSLSVGTIQGGVSVNTIPDHCLIEIDRRLLPHESPAGAYQTALAAIAARLQPGDNIEHAPAFITSRGLSTARNQPLADRLSAIANRSGLFGKQIGVPFGTDAAAFDAAGVPAVVFGPGDIAQAHTADEWIELRQINLAADILTQFCLESGSA